MGGIISILGEFKEWVTGEQKRKEEFETLLRQYTYAVKVEQAGNIQGKSYLLEENLTDTEGEDYVYSELR